MKKILLYIVLTITTIFCFYGCNKENEIKLAPMGSLKINITRKDYSHNKSKTAKLQSMKMEELPISFTATITLEGEDVPRRTTFADAKFNGNLYQLLLPIEAPFDKRFTISITTRTDSTSWKGALNDIILQEDRLPLQLSIMLEISSIMDIDGNEYNTVHIGSRLWLASNLRVTHYRNRNPITYAPDATQWKNLTFSGGYCSPNNSNLTNYGRLYKYYTTVDNRGLCPSGWSVASQADWTDLANALGGAATAGGDMKISGTSDWASPNVGADNSSGFSAYPSLSRDVNGIYSSQTGSVAVWWSTSFLGTGIGPTYSITNNSTSLTFGSQSMEAGAAIRCIKL